MKQRQTLPYLTAALATQISDALAELQPDMVLVHGDTTTTFMGALTATYAKIPVGHVEAGLRSHQKFSPFPEEVNRMLTDQVSDLCFAPTEEARQNLLHAGIDAEQDRCRRELNRGRRAAWPCLTFMLRNSCRGFDRTAQ